jgi:hypothetical protein
VSLSATCLVRLLLALIRSATSDARKEEPIPQASSKPLDITFESRPNVKEVKQKGWIKVQHEAGLVYLYLYSYTRTSTSLCTGNDLADFTAVFASHRHSSRSTEGERGEGEGLDQGAAWNYA